MDDEVLTGWRIDPDVRAAMRLDRARMARDRGAVDHAVMELEELLDEDPEHVEALFLLGETQLDDADFGGAALAYAHCVDVSEQPAAEALSGLAVARLNLCDLPGAIDAARRALVSAPDLAEAHYTLGLALEWSDAHKAEAVQAFATARALAPEQYPYPLRVKKPEWEGLIRKALLLLPEALQDFWADVPVLLLPRPDLDELRASEPPITPTVTGLYQGIPPDDDVDPWEVRPEAIRLFIDNLVRSPTRPELIEAIARTFDHEARDWLDLTPDEIP